jgi:hypothetical protein
MLCRSALATVILGATVGSLVGRVVPVVRSLVSVPAEWRGCRCGAFRYLVLA